MSITSGPAVGLNIGSSKDFPSNVSVALLVDSVMVFPSSHGSARPDGRAALHYFVGRFGI
jgi:hypothetical protein